MGDKTRIEWTDASWNPLRGCTAVSAGCDNCYAASVALRFSGEGLAYAGLAVKDDAGRPEWTGRIMLVPEHLHDPLRWTRPRRIFVNSMSDLFHAAVPREYIDHVFAVMALTPRHTYQILTKRPQRMANYLHDTETRARIARAARDVYVHRNDSPDQREEKVLRYIPWPLPNVWVGTSVEDARVTHRIDALRRCPAAVRFLSCEPLIGDVGTLDLAGIGWVIAGGESGPGHRPCDPAWVRSLRDQCVAMGVPFFFKQWGGLTPKSGGRELDGLVWSQFPVVAVPV